MDWTTVSTIAGSTGVSSILTYFFGRKAARVKLRKAQADSAEALALAEKYKAETEGIVRNTLNGIIADVRAELALEKKHTEAIQQAFRANLATKEAAIGALETQNTRQQADINRLTQDHQLCERKYAELDQKYTKLAFDMENMKKLIETRG